MLFGDLLKSCTIPKSTRKTTIWPQVWWKNPPTLFFTNTSSVIEKSANTFYKEQNMQITLHSAVTHFVYINLIHTAFSYEHPQPSICTQCNISFTCSFSIFLHFLRIFLHLFTKLQVPRKCHCCVHFLCLFGGRLFTFSFLQQFFGLLISRIYYHVFKL